jgi:hypothetical protein
VLARVKVSAHTANIYAKTGATTGTTMSGTNSGFQWWDLGEITADGSALEIHAWATGGAGTVSVDRIEAFLTEDRLETPSRYSGARDCGQAALMDSRVRGTLAAR